MSEIPLPVEAVTVKPCHDRRQGTQRVKKATPSTPVEILGLNSVPAAGETFVVCDSDKEAKSFADTYISEEKEPPDQDTKAKMSLDDLFSQDPVRKI